MIPIIAGIAAAGPVANMFSEITKSISQPDAAKFDQSLQAAQAKKPEQIQLNALLQGRSPSQLSIEEQQKLANLLVGKTVQMIGNEGQPIQGVVSQSKNTGSGIQLDLQGQSIDLSQIASIQIA
jgi:hypothetical protein